MKHRGFLPSSRTAHGTLLLNSFNSFWEKRRQKKRGEGKGEVGFNMQETGGRATVVKATANRYFILYLKPGARRRRRGKVMGFREASSRREWILIEDGATETYKSMNFFHFSSAEEEEEVAQARRRPLHRCWVWIRSHCCRVKLSSHNLSSPPQHTV